MHMIRIDFGMKGMINGRVKTDSVFQSCRFSLEW